MLSVSKRIACQRVKEKNSSYLYTSGPSVKLVPVLSLKYLDLDAITVEGRGVHRSFPDQLNTFLIRGTGIQARDVNVSISNCDVVNIKTSPDIIEVDYRVHAGDLNVEESITVTVVIAGSLHSVFNVTLGVSSTAAAGILGSFRPDQTQWISVLTDYCHNRDLIFSAAIHYRYARANGWFFPPEPALIAMMNLINRYHMTDEKLQTEVLTCVLPGLNDECVNSVSGHVFAAMDANLTSETVQFLACWAILVIARESYAHRRILLQGRAVEVCSRACRIFPQNRRMSQTLKYLHSM